MNFYISDLHLFHKNVTEEGSNFDKRPFKTLDEMHRVIKERWNEVVSNADHVYVLGDFVWKESEEAIAFVSTLKGNKHLILGNHDRVSDQRYRQLFVEVVEKKEVKDVVDGERCKVVLSHFPIAAWNRQHHSKVVMGEVKAMSVHLYGHLHESPIDAIYSEFLGKLEEYYGFPCVARNVGCMLPHMDYTPRRLEEILGSA